MPERRSVPDAPAGGAFGPNAWLVDDMYEQYRADPSSVPQSWQDFFADYVPPRQAVAASAAAGNGELSNDGETASAQEERPVPSPAPPPAPAARTARRRPS